MTENKLAQWWRPETPTERLPGTLFEDGDDGGLRLLIDGHFAETNAEPAAAGLARAVRPPLDDVPLLLGTTADGKNLSLIDCRTVKGSGLPGLTKTFQVFRPKIIAYDVHFASVDEFRLTSLSGRYLNLDQWVDTSGVSYAFPSENLYPISITYARPEEVKATLSNGISVNVDFSVTGPDFGNRTAVQIQQQAWLGVRSSDERSYEELLRGLTMVADFVSLGIGQAVRLAEIQAGAMDSESTEHPQRTIYFRLHHNSEPIAPLREDIDPWRMLFTLNDIRENFAKILEVWCIQQEKIRPLYSLYFGTLRSASMYVEHRFLNMFQALESFDRRDFEPTSEAIEKHGERKKRILHAVQIKKDRDWLEGKLRYSHEPSATERLKRLVEKYDAAWIFEDAPKEIELAGNFRNFYTHYDPKLVSKLPELKRQPSAMHNLAVRFQVLCEIILLREVGFPADQIRKRIQETQRLERRLVL
jgi:hypothetical protein